jgi:hypothetical protein
MLAFDAGCLEVPQPALAAMLVPTQAITKYTIGDRLGFNRAFADAAACRYLTTFGETDERPAPFYPLLANGQAVPLVFGYLPFDDQGALELARAQALIADSDVFGPGQSMCRGACGADCEENNCGEPVEEWRCEKQDGKNDGTKRLWRRYTCGEHPGCIEHDACFDNCKVVFGVDSWTAGFCMRGCDMQAANGYGAGQGVEWAQGYGPYTHEKSYDYSQGEPIRDERACPLGLELEVVPSSGIAPHRATIHWEGLDVSTGVERCRLDLGDGTDEITIDPCAASGDFEHLYMVPSDLRRAVGVYTVTLHQVGHDVTATADVEASWRFFATPESGTAPFDTRLDWEGLRGVSKTLSCTIDFGDGSAPETIEDCARGTGVDHTYAEAGTYLPKITVRGEDRPVTRSLIIRVTEPTEARVCDHVLAVENWRATATFGYQRSATQGDLSVMVATSGNMQATLRVFVPGEQGMSFIDDHPSGTIRHTNRATSSAPNADNPIYEFIGDGLPVPPTDSTDGGSNFLLAFDLERCLYNVHVQGLVAGTARSGNDSAEAQSFGPVFQTKWRPIPEDLILADEAAYSAHGTDFILDAPNVFDWYLVENDDLIDFLGEDGLGQGTVSWHFEPIVE